MNPRLIILDVDDTLLPATSGIPAENIVAIEEARSAGVEIAIASGRSPGAICRVLDEAGCSPRLVHNDLLIVGFNGAGAWKGQTEFYCNPLPRSVVESTFAFCKSLDLQLIALSKNRLFSLKTDCWSALYSKKHSTRCELLASYPAEPIVKIGIMSCYGDSELSKRIDEHLGIGDSVAAEPTMSAFRTKPQFTHTKTPCEWAEAVATGVNKGVAVFGLSKALGIPLHKIACIGDGINDKGMLAIPEVTSVVMGDSQYPELLALADFVTKGVEDDPPGVAYAIRGLMSE